MSVDGFIEDYRKLEKYADNLASKYPLVSGGDILNRAYINFSESKEEYSFEGFKKKINLACEEEVNLHTGEKNINVVVGFSETEKQCRACKEVFPVDCFYSFTKKSGQVMKAAYCIKCDNEKSREYGKKRALTYDKINKRNRMGRENLAAWYILKALRRSGVKKDDITPQMVLDKINQLIQKRKLKAA